MLSDKTPREIDALVAEHVMGWERKRKRIGKADLVYEFQNLNVPHYSTDIKAAWEVVEKTNFFMRWLLIGPDIAGGWYAEEAKPRSMDKLVVRSADTAPMAICLAALKAKGVSDAK